MTVTLEQQFAARQHGLPGSEAFARARREAFDSFRARGFPTRRDERWHYTDLKPLASANFDTSPAQPNAAAQDAVAACLETLQLGAAPRAVFVDGCLHEGLSRLDTPAGVELISLAADSSGFDRIAEHRAGTGEHVLAALNTAFASEGLGVRVSAGAVTEAPLHIVFAGGSCVDAAQQPRIVVDLERDAALTVVVHYVDVGGERNWMNVVTQIAQAEGSRLKLYRLQEHGPTWLHTSLLRAELGRDAVLEIGQADFGARLTRNDIDVHLVEPGASLDLFGVFLAGDGQHIDNHIQVAHRAPHTTSRQTFRGIADGDGRGIFDGKIVVHRDAQRIDARQSSDNLLLSERAEIDTKPALEIYADDVKCSHGATIGELDAEQLFYLRSRGMDEATARSLLTFAFANSVLERLAPESLRRSAAARIAAHLPEELDTEVLS